MNEKKMENPVWIQAKDKRVNIVMREREVENTTMYHQPLLSGKNEKGSQCQVWGGGGKAEIILFWWRVYM